MNDNICSLCHTRIDKLYVVFKPDHRIFYYHMYCYQKEKPDYRFSQERNKEACCTQNPQ